jgi:hypothetical protein
MKALSIQQPWASLIASGAKIYETRSWPTQWRGDIAIHASKQFTRDQRALCEEDPFYSALCDAMPDLDGGRVDDLPLGCIIAVGTLKACFTTDLFSALDFRSPRHRSNEAAFGDWSAGRYAFHIADVQQLAEPIPCVGNLGLWTVPCGLLPEINRQLTLGDPDCGWGAVRRMMREQMR